LFKFYVESVSILVIYYQYTYKTLWKFTVLIKFIFYVQNETGR